MGGGPRAFRQGRVQRCIRQILRVLPLQSLPSIRKRLLYILYTTGEDLLSSKDDPFLSDLLGISHTYGTLAVYSQAVSTLARRFWNEKAMQWLKRKVDQARLDAQPVLRDDCVVSSLISQKCMRSARIFLVSRKNGHEKRDHL